MHSFPVLYLVNAYLKTPPHSKRGALNAPPCCAYSLVVWSLANQKSASVSIAQLYHSCALSSLKASGSLSRSNPAPKHIQPLMTWERLCRSHAMALSLACSKPLQLPSNDVAGICKLIKSRLVAIALGWYLPGPCPGWGAVLYWSATSVLRLVSRAIVRSSALWPSAS